MKIDIIVPNRIGDSILSLPAIFCLKQLIDTYHPDLYKLNIVCPKQFIPIFNLLGLPKVTPMNLITKFKSWIKPSDLAFFLCSSSDNLGYYSRKTYGEMISKKVLINYTYNAPYLNLLNLKVYFQEKLIDFLKENFNLPLASIRYFGICFDLGYSAEQIMSIYNFDLNIPDKLLNQEIPLNITDYLVFCMEAAYSSKKSHVRRWNEENFIKLTESAYQNYGLSSVFIGVNNLTSLPDKPYITDLRGKTSLIQLMQILKSSKCYIGNDTGPLHLANLLKKPSLGIYLVTNPDEYGPIFGKLNTPVKNPSSVEDVDRLLCDIIQIKCI